MSGIKEIILEEILAKLPDIKTLNCAEELTEQQIDIFFCALGFEERCLSIPEKLSALHSFKCNQMFYFDYSTNIDDNAINRSKLINYAEKFSNSRDSIKHDDDFTKNLRELLNDTVKYKQKPKIMFDISSCSSLLLLSVMKVLWEFDLCLRIVYSEANIYHPTSDEFAKEPEKWTKENEFGIARGVGKVISSAEYPGGNRENPNLIVAFPTFKPERTKAIITYVDESLTLNPGKRVIWIIGEPHMNEDTKNERIRIIKQINSIELTDISYNVSTLNYKNTMKVLEQIYKKYNLDYHLNISALGSKMQSIGISLFCYIRPDVPLYFAIPKEFNPNQYTEGCKENWQIDFGDIVEIQKLLNTVDQIETTTD